MNSSLKIGVLPVASAKGGLGETVGPCGLLFANGNFQELASVLERVLMDQELRQTLVSHGPKHLERFRPGFVSKQYLDLFQEVLKS
jgi:glycogen(starch) synthase